MGKAVKMWAVVNKRGTIMKTYYDTEMIFRKREYAVRYWGMMTDSAAYCDVKVIQVRVTTLRRKARG